MRCSNAKDLEIRKPLLLCCFSNILNSSSSNNTQPLTHYISSHPLLNSNVTSNYNNSFPSLSGKMSLFKTLYVFYLFQTEFLCVALAVWTHFLDQVGLCLSSGFQACTMHPANFSLGNFFSFSSLLRSYPTR